MANRGGMAAAVVLVLLVWFLAAPVFSALSITPAYLKVPVSNTSSAEFSIEVLPEGGESFKYVTLTAVWPRPDELSWTTKSVLVGQRGSTRLSLRPRTVGEDVLTIRLTGEGVLPQEEYATVVVEEVVNYTHLLSSIEDGKARISALEKEMAGLDRVRYAETFSKLDEFNSTLATIESLYYDSRYSLVNDALSKFDSELPKFEDEVSATIRQANPIASAFPFLPRQFESVSFDLTILIIVLVLIIALTAKTFLF